MSDSALDQETIEFGASSLLTGDAPVVGLTVLQHPNLARVGQVCALFSSAVGGLRRISRLEPDFHAHAETGGGPLASPTLSRSPLLIRTPAHGRISVENPGSLVSGRVQGKPLPHSCEFELAELQRGILIELSQCVLLLLHYLDPERDARADLGLVGESREIRRVREQVRRVADLEACVLIRGETGSGKELVARAIHAQSRRKDQPLVSVNMAAIPATMGASSLFGHARGAFTGATTSAPGFFGSAHGGTLFLDEIGETAPELQPLLLRALREAEIQPVGEPRSRRVDVRILSATDADLDGMVERKAFSLPLFKRLDGYNITLPPLRQRRDDLARLFFRFLARELSAMGEDWKLAEPEPRRKPWLPVAVLSTLLEHHWPGNVAELESVAKRIAYDNRQLDRFRADPAWLGAAGAPAAPAASVPSPDSGRVSTQQKPGARELSDEQIVQGMREHQFSIRAAARALGVSRSWLTYRLEECSGLRKGKDLDKGEILTAARELDWNVLEMSRRLEVSEHGLKLRLKTLGLRAQKRGRLSP